MDPPVPFNLMTMQVSVVWVVSAADPAELQRSVVSSATVGGHKTTARNGSAKSTTSIWTNRRKTELIKPGTAEKLINWNSAYQQNLWEQFSYPLNPDGDAGTLRFLSVQVGCSPVSQAQMAFQAHLEVTLQERRRPALKGLALRYLQRCNAHFHTFKLLHQNLQWKIPTCEIALTSHVPGTTLWKQELNQTLGVLVLSCKHYLQMVHQCFKLRPLTSPLLHSWAARSPCPCLPLPSGALAKWVQCWALLQVPSCLWWLDPKFRDDAFVSVSVSGETQHPRVPVCKISSVFMIGSGDHIFHHKLPFDLGHFPSPA